MSTRALAVIVAAAALAGCANRPAAPSSAAKLPASCMAVTQLKTTPAGKYAEPDRAIEYTTACMTDLPANATKALSLRFLARAYTSKGDTQQAVADLEEANRLTPPASIWTAVQLAVAYRENNQPEKAVTFLSALRDGPPSTKKSEMTENMPFYYHMGLANIKLERWPETAESMSEGLKYQPDFVGALLSRAVAYDKMGQAQLSRDELKAAEIVAKKAWKDASASDVESTIAFQSEPPFKDFLVKNGYRPETFGR